MKRILSMIFAVIMAFGCFAVVGSAEFKENQLKTSYDATKCTSTYVCTKEVCKGNEPYTITYSYNSSGRLTKEVEKSDYYSHTNTYAYSSNDNLKKSVEKYSYYSVSKTYTYNSSNKITKTAAKYSDGSTAAYSYTYNSKGYMTNLSIKSYEAGYGNSSETTTYTYNSKGLPTRSVNKNPYGTVTETYTYNSKGLLTKKSVVSTNDSSLTCTYTYTYNSKGNLTKESLRYAGGFTSTITYTYNSAGCLTKKVQKYSSGSTSTTTYTWKKISVKSPVIAGSIHIQYAKCKYTGKAKTPNITIDGLDKGVDYKVTYSNNVKVGTAKAKITFLGENATQHPVTITYKITK